MHGNQDSEPSSNFSGIIQRVLSATSLQLLEKGKAVNDFPVHILDTPLWKVILFASPPRGTRDVGNRPLTSPVFFFLFETTCHVSVCAETLCLTCEFQHVMLSRFCMRVLESISGHSRLQKLLSIRTADCGDDRFSGYRLYRFRNRLYV